MDISKAKGKLEPLKKTDLDDCPAEQFKKWLKQGLDWGFPEPKGFILANKDGGISQRTILLKNVDKKGVVFFTNYNSEKVQAIIDDSPRVSLLFSWNGLGRQGVVAGRAKKLSKEKSAAYFATRPRTSQLGALASKQILQTGAKERLMMQYEKVVRSFEGDDAADDFWGGYLVEPDSWEFLQDSVNGQDRFLYKKPIEARSGWDVVRV